MNPFFSIVIPVYNSEKYLAQCFQSIAEQSFSDFEVIVIDDGSIDLSGQLCEQQSVIDKRFHIRHQKNAGAIVARREGIRAAKGDYIICADSDDYFDRDLLHYLYEVCIKDAPDIVCYDYQEVDEYGKPGNIFKSLLGAGLYLEKDLKEIKKKLLYDVDQNRHNMGAIAFSTWSKAIRRELMEAYAYLSPIGIRNGEDLSVTIPAISHSSSIYIMHKVGYYYRILNNSMVHSFRENELEGIVKVISHINNYTEGIPYNNICGYAYCMVLGQTVLASRQMKSFRLFKEYVKKHINPELWVYIRSFKHQKLNWYSKMRLFLIKNNLLLYWCVCRYIR